MIFDVASLVHYVSQCMVLQPVMSSPPAARRGWRSGRPSKPYLRDGVVVEAEVSGLGAQRQLCRVYRSA
jgi:2-keto-4-pentenoate hydratase/2-oxohepta-3-ene-1,7-dioic acid hydratase in catechol pathway